MVADQAHAACLTADAAVAKIVGRIGALASDRASIVARRAAGDARPDDGATLELISADSEGLLGMKPAAVNAAAAAGAAYQRAAADLAAAKAAFKAEEGRMTLAALHDHAARLITLLEETLQQARTVAAGLPPIQQQYHRMTARLADLDAVMVAELVMLQGAPRAELPYSAHPEWKPSAELYTRVWRLNANTGRFV
jgi:hypothetical protein